MDSCHIEKGGRVGLFVVVNAVFEASYSQPTGFDSFIAYCALTMTAMLPSLPVAAEAPSAVRPQPGWGRPAGAN